MRHKTKSMEAAMQSFSDVNVTVERDILDDLFKHVIIEHCNKRCEHINSFTKGSVIEDNRGTSVKLFGDDTLIYNTSKWITFNSNSFEHLKIKEDLQFCDSDLLLIINQHVKFFEIEDKVNFRLISKFINTIPGDATTLGDLKGLIVKLFNITPHNLH